MPTVKPRLNLTLPDDLRTVLLRAARRDRVPAATKAARLLALALELEEDALLDTLASVRDTAGARSVSHAEAWR